MTPEDLNRQTRKAMAWADPYSTLPPVFDPAFRWHTMDDRILTARQMATFHLFNSLKMIWNHTVLPQYRFLPYKQYNARLWKVIWTQKKLRYAIQNLFHELMLRPDRTATMNATLQQMATYLTNRIQIYNEETPPPKTAKNILRFTPPRER